MSSRVVLDDVNVAVARQAGDDNVRHGVVGTVEPFSQVGEQFHVLRNQLMLRWFNGESSRKALAIISADRSEGRSFIAANLAMVFAQLGARTVLVDADLRHSCQARLFKLEDLLVVDAFAIHRSGLSNMLAGETRREGVVVSGVMPNLSVLPAGATTLNPHELLSRPAFGQLLHDLAKEFDVILIDTPAARNYAEAQTLALCAGAALVLARKDLTSAADLFRLVCSLQQSGVELVGSVFNEL